MINCVVIDDEPLAIELLKDFIDKTPNLVLKQSFLRSIEALHYVETEQVDLVFLDVQMPDLNGMDFLRQLKLKQAPIIILTTAYQQFAVEGYQFDVAGFLEKPVSYPLFLHAVRKAQQVKQLRGEQEKSSLRKFLFVRTEYKLMKINFEDILYIESMKDYSKIYTVQSSKAIITLQNLKTFEEKLPNNDFVRIHRSYIISVNHIDMIHKNSVMIGENEIPVSDGFRAQLNLIINRYS